MPTLKTLLAALRRSRPDRPSCDACAFVEFFRSNGDGQSARLQAFCRCSGGPFANRPIPPDRYCQEWQQSSAPVDKPTVGDPTLSV